MSTELTTAKSETTLVPSAPEEAIEQLEILAGACRELQHSTLSEFQRTFQLAAAKRRLDELITTEMMVDVMALQGSKCGFIVDNDKSGKPNEYPIEVVKEIMIEATLKGLRMVGNEVNIIAGNLYAAQAGMKRLVKEWPGLTDLRIEMHPSETRGQHRVVPCKASYILDGECKIFEFTGNRAIPIRVNANMIEDAIQGKAKRKLFARLYDGLTGCEHGLVEDDGYDDTIDVASSAVPENHHDTLPQDYKDRIAATTMVNDVNSIARDIAMDSTLSQDAKREGQNLCNTRRNAIKAGLGNKTEVGTKQEQLFDTSENEPDSQDGVDVDALVDGLLKKIEAATTITVCTKIKDQVDTDPAIPQADRAMLQENLTEKMNEIRGKRGERTNRKGV